MSSFSFFFHIILLLFSICLAKKIGITNNNYGAGGYSVPVQMNAIPVYNPQIPPNNIGYYSPYPNQMGYNNMNINPPSKTPI